MSDPRVVRPACPDFTPEQERDTRARAWAYVFDCYEAKKKAGVPLAGDGMKGSEHDHPAKRMLPC